MLLTNGRVIQNHKSYGEEHSERSNHRQTFQAIAVLQQFNFKSAKAEQNRMNYQGRFEKPVSLTRPEYNLLLRPCLLMNTGGCLIMPESHANPHYAGSRLENNNGSTSRVSMT